ncbi:hypothetical protein C8R44DRAFT_750984 [Mycena epipterygia]|nr:hypothetical protein C8R44DRAFT_750984 [Mycena epipterygia]
MPIQLKETDCTLGPPGSREGLREVVHPSRECLQAASSEHEISRSQGTRGPIPGYHSLGPSCNGSLALAVTELSEEQRVANTINYTENENTNPHTENEYSHIQDNINGEPNEPRIVGNDWETENLAIQKRNKPPRVLKSGKFTRSNLTIGSLNIAGRDVNMSMLHKNHKFAFLKQTIDTNKLGILGIQEYLLEKKTTDRLAEESEKKKTLSEARYDVEGENLRTSWTRSAKG